MRYISRPATSFTNYQFEIVEDIPNGKVYCVCRNERDLKLVLKNVNANARRRELRQFRKYLNHG